LEGFGAKSQQEILEALQAISPATQNRIRIDQADSLSQEIITYLNQNPDVIETSVLGSGRRRKSTVGDIDLGLTTKNPTAVVSHIKNYPQNTKLISAGDELVRFSHSSGQNVDIKLVNPQIWGSLLQHFTGSKSHNIALRERALKQNYSL